MPVAEMLHGLLRQRNGVFALPAVVDVDFLAFTVVT